MLSKNSEKVLICYYNHALACMRACSNHFTFIIRLVTTITPYPSSTLDFNEILINKKVDPNWILAATTTASFVMLKISL